MGDGYEFTCSKCGKKYAVYGLHRLIHRKTGDVSYDQWYWNQVPNSQELWKKEERLKPDYWPEVRDTYLRLKNMYLSRQLTKEHPSFVCYIEAVNEVYDRVRRNLMERE